MAVSDGEFTHLGPDGSARMVDVSGKAVSTREAEARCVVGFSPAVADALRSGGVPKGDALATARIAAICAAKRTSDLIPLCHPIAVHSVDVYIEVKDDCADITVAVRTADRTGVEMEALTAAAVGGLALIDMVKGLDRTAAICEVVLLAKRGGRSGDWIRP
jgi:cyclic pyranopterin phosphate synthase